MTALVLAKYIVTKCVDDGCAISNLQLQKILYYIQRDYLHKHKEPAFDDDIEAWKFGPVVPEVYYAFCYYGAMSILNRYDEADIEDCDRDLIDGIIEAKREMEPWDLVAETHKTGGAWDKTFTASCGKPSVIPLELIRRDS
ncbi:MAG: DUF4065 domain-containing protein [Ruminococcaceae bacterium]|nr:DUF4065 domain-containing protein [Oscillospiraceae bacterium]